MADKIRVFEAFAGIGAQSRALEQAGIDFEVVGMAEWYIDAIIAYGLMRNVELSIIPVSDMILFLRTIVLSKDSKNSFEKIEKLNENEIRILYSTIKKFNNFGSISSISANELPSHDLLTYSFPCQDISQAGLKKGFSKNSSTRSSILWKIEELLKELKNENRLPKYLLMENVKAIDFRNNYKNFENFKKSLVDLGYKTNVKLLLNAKNFGIPQNRQRIFLVSSLEKIDESKLLNLQTKCKDTPIFKFEEIIDKHMPTKAIEKRYLKKIKEKYKGKKIPMNVIHKNVGAYPKHKQSDVLLTPGIDFMPTITYSNESSRQKILIKKSGRYTVVRMTGRENLLMMGFLETDYEKIKKIIISEQKISGLAGNSIVPNVLQEIFKIIFGKNFTSSIKKNFNAAKIVEAQL